MLVCPLCGKSTSLERFDPSDFHDDIVVQTVRGLGRGRGFEVVSRDSVLGDDVVTPLVADRVLDIMSMLLREGCLEVEEVLSRLRIGAKEEGSKASQRELGDSESQDQIQLDETYEDVKGLVDLIEEALKVSSEEWVWEIDKEEEPLEALGERLSDLIDDYERLATNSRADEE
jgi:hypothetical protein